MLEQVAFSELQLDAPVAHGQAQAIDERYPGAYDVHHLVLRKTTAEAEGWRLKEAVPGFQPMSFHTRGAETASSPGNGAPCNGCFLMGWRRCLLFVEPFDAQRHGAEKSAVTGATHSLTRRVGGVLADGIGARVPPATLRRFATALERTR